MRRSWTPARAPCLDRQTALLTLLGLSLLVGLCAGCSPDPGTPTRPPDTTPPAQTNLRVEAIGVGAVDFSWRAPGDDGMSGQAERYELRYATTPLSPESWSGAMAADTLPEPHPVRTTERYLLTGLLPETTYYFGLRVRDGAGNWSDPSPVVNLTIPSRVGDPILYQGKVFPEEGTVASCFCFQVSVWLDGGDVPVNRPLLVIGDVAHEMHWVRDDSRQAIYEYHTRFGGDGLEFHFAFTDDGGNSCRHPNPSEALGPRVEDCVLTEMEFADLEPDTFCMGNPCLNAPSLEQPEHQVALTHLYRFDRYEVTNARYAAALNWALEEDLVWVEQESLVVSIRSGATLLELAIRPDDPDHGVHFAPETGFTPIAFRENWPVAHVTWYGAAFFCNVRSLWDGLTPAYDEYLDWSCAGGDPYGAQGWRLPTEAEWEGAARGSDDRPYPTGTTPPEAGVEANFASALGHPSAVGSFDAGATALQIHDLAGNVWEWCNDWRADYGVDPDTSATIARIDPIGPAEGIRRVARGGCWDSALCDICCYRRLGLRPEARHAGVGFRCAETLER